MFVGIDVGTSSVKVVAIDEDGKLTAQTSVSLSISRPSATWSEQDPDDWWKAVDGAIQQLDAAIRRKTIAIGLSGQMHGATLLDASDRPLRPAILWNDGRSFAECALFEQREPASRSISANLAMPGFTAPKLLWVRDHEPEIFARTRTVLLPKDYARLRMTGEKISDVSDSSGTLWLDVARRAWSDALLAACDLSRDHMPRLAEGTEPVAKLLPSVAARWGMPQAVVAAGASDNAAGAAGVGIAREGDGLVSLGTSGVTFVATDRLRANPDRAVHAFCHCFPGLWHQMAVHLSAAACVEWVGRLVGLPQVADAFSLAETAAQDPRRSEVFLPYLSGERTPHNDPHVRGAFFGLSHDTSASRLAIAVLEGVAFSLANGLDVLRESGSDVRSLSVIGGGARSRFWGSILASALNVNLEYLEGGDVGPALGAARLARIAATGASVETVCTRPAIRHFVAPDPLLAERLAPRRARFDAAYQAFRTL